MKAYDRVTDEDGNPAYTTSSITSPQAVIVNNALFQYYGLRSLTPNSATLLKSMTGLEVQVTNAQAYKDKSGALFPCALQISHIRADAAARYTSFDIENVFCSKLSSMNVQTMKQLK